MSDAVNILSKKRLNEFKQTVINDVIDLILYYNKTNFF